MKMEFLLMLLLTTLMAGQVNGQTKYSLEKASAVRGHGRLIVEHEGQELAVCSEGWDDARASILCSYMGYHDGLAFTLPKSGRATLCLDQEGMFYCSRQVEGMEKTISTVCSAPNATEAGVLCFKDVKLDNHHITPTTITGQLAVWEEDQVTWRGVCGLLGHNELGVACRELHFTHGLFLAPDPNNHFQGYSLACQGWESSVTECHRQKQACYHDVRIMCYNGQEDEGWEWSIDDGRVQVIHMGITGAVCSGGWDDAAATALCRQHGRKGGVAVQASSGLNDHPMLVSKVECPEDASDMAQCHLDLAVSMECQLYSNPAHVACDKAPELHMEPEGQMAGHYRLVIKEDGEKGVVCGEGWSDKGAAIACHMKAFPLGVAVQLPKSGRPAIISDLNCSGHEHTLLECPHHVRGNNSSMVCSGPNNTEAGIICFNTAKLENPQITNSTIIGTLSLAADGHDHWAGVCGHLGLPELTVVCRELHLTHGLLLDSHIRHSYEGYSLVCRGNETSLSRCQTTRVQCYHDIKVMCYNMTKDDGWTWSIESGNYGRIQVTHVGITGAVCSGGWNDEAATALCRQHGKKGGVDLGVNRADLSQNPMLVNSVTCPGGASNMLECHVDHSVSMECQQFSMSATVLCYDTAPPQVKLVDGPNSLEGRPVLELDGKRGSICPNELSSTNARMICKSAGYHGGEWLNHTTVARSAAEPVFLPLVSCLKDHSGNVLTCAHHGFNNNQPSCDNVTAVRCLDPEATGPSMSQKVKVVLCVTIPVVVLVVVLVVFAVVLKKYLLCFRTFGNGIDKEAIIPTSPVLRFVNEEGRGAGDPGLGGQRVSVHMGCGQLEDVKLDIHQPVKPGGN